MLKAFMRDVAAAIEARSDFDEHYDDFLMGDLYTAFISYDFPHASVRVVSDEKFLFQDLYTLERYSRTHR